MKILFNNENREVEEIKKKNITIQLDKNIVFKVSINNFGELVIQKQNFGEGESSIIIKPSVSNEIRLS